MARKDRGFGFEGGNIVPFSRGKHGVASSWVASPSETNKRTMDSHHIMHMGALVVCNNLQKSAKNVIRNRSNEKINKLKQALETLLGSVDKDWDIS